jgi:hypothetical protein
LDVQEEYEQVHATEMKSNLSRDEDLLRQVMNVGREKHQDDFPNVKHYLLPEISMK